MSSIFDALTSELSGDSLGALAQNLGADSSQTQSAVAAALPLLVGALTRNASTPTGAQSLASALERDHSQPLSSHASALGGMGGLLQAALGAGGGNKSLDGAGILGHLLGGQQQGAAESVARESGLDAATVGKLLVTLAPIVMSSLGTVKQTQNLDAGGLSGYLQQQSQTMPGASSGLGSLMDPAADGVGVDDLVRMGSMLHQSGLLSKLF